MTDYATLQSDVAALSARSTLTAAIPGFIRLAEAVIRRKVRVLEMQTQDTLSVDDTGAVALPERFLGFKSVSLADAGLSAGAELTYMPPSKFHETDLARRSFSSRVLDAFYTIEAGNLLLSPRPGSGDTTDVRVTYWQAFEPLSDTVTTNWLITNHYDVYLNASLAELNDYLMDVEQEMKYRARFASIVEDLHKSELRKQRSGPNIRRPRAVV